MTAGHDGPPLTRREARERERLLAAQAQAPVGTDRAFEPVLAAGSESATTSEDATESLQDAESRHDTESRQGTDYYRRSVSPPEPLTAPGVPSPRAEPVEDPSADTPASSPVVPSSGEVPEHTLTRRELRAMLRAQEEAESGPVALPAAPVSSPVTTGPPGTPDGRAETPAPPTEAPATDPGEGSAGTTTTPSALILPSFGTTTGPLTSTGEVFVTGSIDLPHSLSSTGTHDAIHDSAEIDRLFDQPEEAVNTGEMKPVRASRAISSREATSQLMPQQKARRGRLPAILAGTAAVLAAGVAGLIVTGYVMGLL